MTKIEKLLSDYYKTIDILKEQGHELAPDEPLHEKVLNILTTSNFKEMFLEMKKLATEAAKMIKEHNAFIGYASPSTPVLSDKADKFLNRKAVKSLLKGDKDEQR